MNIAEQYISDEIADLDEFPEFDLAIQKINEYRDSEQKPIKQVILDKWSISDKEIHELVISVFTAILSYQKSEVEITYQALIGMINNKIKLNDELDRVKIAADVIGCLVSAELLVMTSEVRKEHVISTEFEFDDIPVRDDHPVKFSRPMPMKKNHNKEGHVMCGNPMKHHDLPVRLAHLNRMNKVRFSLDQDFIAEYDEYPSTPPDTEQKEAQVDLFVERSALKYEEIGTDVFYINHKYDSRGRVYSSNHYVNPQGISFKKAVICFANAEVVQGD